MDREIRSIVASKAETSQFLTLWVPQSS